MNRFNDAYLAHEGLSKRRQRSTEVLTALRSLLSINDGAIATNAIGVFAAGSLGRLEFGAKSDLDLFFLSLESTSRLVSLEVCAQAIEVNRELQLPLNVLWVRDTETGCELLGRSPWSRALIDHDGRRCRKLSIRSAYMPAY